jgi:hypothetical protein
MQTLHIAPGDSAGGSIAQAVRDAGRDDEVLRFLDDLSCGPIATNEPSARAIWWDRFHEAPKVRSSLERFWERVTTTDARLVVWFGRHSARELAFFLAWVDRLGDRPYQIIDVTGQQLPFKKQDGSMALSRPVQCASTVRPEALKLLVGTERPMTAREIDEGRQRWQRLRHENAPFRIVTETGLVSTSIDYFDPLILSYATSEWQTVINIVADTMGYHSEPYFQVGDLMLRARIAALVDEGRLLADGDPWDMHCRIRLSRQVIA